MNPREHRFGIAQQYLQFEFVDLAHPVAGVDNAEAPIELHLELVNPMGTWALSFFNNRSRAARASWTRLRSVMSMQIAKYPTHKPCSSRTGVASMFTVKWLPSRRTSVHSRAS